MAPAFVQVNHEKRSPVDSSRTQPRRTASSSDTWRQCLSPKYSSTTYVLEIIHLMLHVFNVLCFLLCFLLFAYLILSGLGPVAPPWHKTWSLIDGLDNLKGHPAIPCHQNAVRKFCTAYQLGLAT